MAQDILITPGQGTIDFTGPSNETSTLESEGYGLIYKGFDTNTDLRFKIEGNEGTLFEVVDDLTDSLFSVNDSSGLPILEVFHDDTVVMGEFGENTLVVDGKNVGIGTDNPLATLHLYNNNTGELLRLEAADTTGDAFISFYEEGNATRKGLIGYPYTGSDRMRISQELNDDIEIYTNDTERLRILNNGNIGIGTSTPSTALELDGEFTFNINPHQINFITDDSARNIYRVNQNGTSKWEFQYEGSLTTEDLIWRYLPDSEDIFHIKNDGSVRADAYTTPNYSMEYNSNSDSLDFVYTG